MIFEQGQRIVFIGDSITDCGRRDANAPYGNGYMSLVHAFVTARHPELDLSWENRGIGGNTVKDLEARWDEDVIALNPDWLSIKIGINDVWRRYKEGREHEAVSDADYETTLRALIQRAVDQTGCKLIVAEPYVIEKDRDNSQRTDTERIAGIARKVANEFGAIVVRTQEAFDTALQHSEPEDWSHDRIHPNLAGHAIIAQAYLRAIDFGL